MGVSAAWRGKDRSPQNLAGSVAAALITSMIILTSEQWAAVLHNVFEITIMRGGIACRGTAYSSDGQVRGHPEARLTGTIMGFMPVGDCARECPYCRSRLLKHGFKARTIHVGDPKGFSSGGPAFTKSTVLLQIMICKNKECRSHSREADENDPTRPVEKRGARRKTRSHECIPSFIIPYMRSGKSRIDFLERCFGMGGGEPPAGAARKTAREIAKMHGLAPSAARDACLGAMAAWRLRRRRRRYERLLRLIRPLALKSGAMRRAFLGAPMPLQGEPAAAAPPPEPAPADGKPLADLALQLLAHCVEIGCTRKEIARILTLRHHGARPRLCG